MWCLKKYYCIIALLVGLTTVGNAAQKTALETLSDLLQSFTTYSASFSQKTLGQQQQLLQTASGVVMIKRPGKFRWEVKQPSAQTLITNGTFFWLYDIDLAQATRQHLSQKTTIDPATLLSGSAKKIGDNFTVRGIFTGRDTTSLLLLPKKNDLGFKKIILTFEGNKLIEMAVENNLSQFSVFSFSDIILNKALSDTLFDFIAPPGVDLIKQA